MTDPARRRNIEDALARAAQALAAADAALGVGSTADAVSRAYYAALHFLRALLFARGLDPRTHSGAQSLFNQHFVRAGLFPTRTNSLLASLQRLRELADYDPSMLFDANDAREHITFVRKFGEDARSVLRSEGFPS